jgi:Domain of unknown function (DUF4440)
MTDEFPPSIERLEERLRLAMLHSNVAELDSLIASELLFTNHLGVIITKQDDLASHQSGELKLKALVPSEQQLRIIGASTIVSVAMHLQGSYLEQPIDLNIRYT